MIRRPLAICLAAAAAALAGCGGDGTGAGAAPTIEQPEGEPTAGLTVRQVLADDSRLPTEGSIGAYRVYSPGAQEPLEVRSQPLVRRVEVFSRDLPPGTYELRSFQRPCVANCSRLSDPVDECEREIELSEGEDVTATVNVAFGEPCRIELSP